MPETYFSQASPYSVPYDPNSINILTGFIFPIVTTIIALILWELLKRLFDKMSQPVFHVYFVENKKPSEVLGVDYHTAFNLPIYIHAKLRFGDIPVLNWFVKRKWRILVNILADENLNIYSLGVRTPTGKYSFGEVMIYDNAPSFLGPETWGAGAKMNAEDNKPVHLKVLLYLDGRDKPYFDKTLMILPKELFSLTKKATKS